MRSLENPQRLPRLAGVLSFYRLFMRPLLFRFDAERIHHLMISIASLLFKLPFGQRATRAVFCRRLPPLPTTVAGLELLNPIGLAAGFDKNAALVPGIENLGFGFVEIGTITPRPQIGNPQPRLMRAPERRAIVNRMGFNNDGAEVIALHLKRVREQVKVPIGVNIGKNRDTPNADALKDYETLLKTFHFLADYFVVNLSSPNTPGLRDLQSGEFIAALGESVLRMRVPQPVFLKLAPDLAHDDLKAIAALCGNGKPFSGLILTNTLPTDLGGLSGYPLKSHSVTALKVARTLVERDVPIISVGGIETVDDVIERFELGANAVQVYSSLIYQGPSLPGRLLRDLQTVMKRRGFRNVSEFYSH